MATGIFVLIMLFQTGQSSGGFGIIQYEFSSLEKCEYARQEIAKAHNRRYSVQLYSQGCYKK